MIDDIDRDSPAAVRKEARAVQARLLRSQARTGGLRFEVYLPPSLADWLLERIERGVFSDPSEAAFAILGEFRDLEAHADLRDELLRRTVQAAIDDPRPTLPVAEAEQELAQRIEGPRPPAAVWHKLP